MLHSPKSHEKKPMNISHSYGKWSISLDGLPAFMVIVLQLTESVVFIPSNSMNFFTMKSPFVKNHMNPKKKNPMKSHCTPVIQSPFMTCPSPHLAWQEVPCRNRLPSSWRSSPQRRSVLWNPTDMGGLMGKAWENHRKSCENLWKIGKIYRGKTSKMDVYS